ncbi:hypothetical protein R5R35_010546 [Gryllus longicercus]|uniref:beta-glucosidase n=1 Tax=Gryllus longicercus TaxID=2509291 RepID=A0AAN9V028_9ORTH
MKSAPCTGTFVAALYFATLWNVVSSYSSGNGSFPYNFLFGAATASYQVEGGWNLSGKGENIWDVFTHTHPEWIADHSSGDIACDSYHNYKKDVKLLKKLQVQVYRFSISWARILPNGDLSLINHSGITYYKNLIAALREVHIEPMVTMYHWDLPQALEDKGGWLNTQMADYFKNYASLLFTLFGDQVKWWITFNEPTEVCTGYVSRDAAPGVVLPGVGDYKAAHTILQAHAKAYHVYDQKFRSKQKGRVSITLSSRWLEPISESSEDIEASERGMQFELGWFAHPIYSKSGDYPPLMRKIVDEHSRAEGLKYSRLPSFSGYWIKYIRGTADFFALNHYTTRLVTSGEEGEIPSKEHDTGVISKVDPSWPSSASKWLKVVPWGFRKLLKWVKSEYRNPPVFVTENGFSDHGELEDNDRIYYHKNYLAELLKAINEDGCKVIGYTVWSIMDNFEWERGYTEKFGVFHVNFSDPARSRQQKKSVEVLSKIFHLKKLDEADNFV